jgi:hypothetical protein
MHLLGFLAFVLLSAAVSYARREQRYRPRWQSLERPAVVAGMGAYRSALTVPGRVEAAPLPLRVMAFTCIFYGRAVTWSLLATAVGTASVLPGFRPIAETTLRAMLGYFSAGLGVGVIATLVLAALVLGAGNDLLLRDHRRAFRRARWVALASMAVHGFVGLHATWPLWLVGVSGRDPSASLAVARSVAAIGFAHAAVLLAMAYAYRPQLTALSSSVRELEA